MYGFCLPRHIVQTRHHYIISKGRAVQFERFVRKSSGFTLMELVITIVIISIMTAVVLMNIGAKAQHGVTTEADMFRRDLSHLQLLAISQGVRLQMTVTSGGYTVTSCSTINSGNGNCTGAFTDPATGVGFSVTLTDAHFTTGTGISGPGNYWLDSLGRPVSAATGATLLSNATVFKLSDGSSSRCVTVTVRPITGFATTDYNATCA